MSEPIKPLLTSTIRHLERVGSWPTSSPSGAYEIARQGADLAASPIRAASEEVKKGSTSAVAAAPVSLLGVKWGFLSAERG